MRRTSCLLIILLLCVGEVRLKASGFSIIKASAQQEPQVTGVRLKGKKLLVFGGNFTEGAVVFINGEGTRTRHDPENPTGMLIAKKGGNRIAPDSLAIVAVQNDNGAMSEGFEFFSGRTITFDDAGKTVTLTVGEKFQLLLKRSSYEWSVGAVDPFLLARPINEPSVEGSQGIFQSLLAGKTVLSATGDLPCSKATPPCPVPTLLFEVTL
ncbi:MAG: hypothetical protein WAV20_19670, partial [Blastocatellia bacterium]